MIEIPDKAYRINERQRLILLDLLSQATKFNEYYDQKRSEKVIWQKEIKKLIRKFTINEK